MENGVQDFKKNWFKDAEARILIVGTAKGPSSTRLLYSKSWDGSISNESAKKSVKDHLDDKL